MEDFANTEVPQLMDQLMTHLNAWGGNPADVNASNQVAALREQLRERLNKSRTNDFSDAWRLALEELGLWDLTGNRLLERIEEIFRRHEITPSTAAEEIAAINAEVQAANAAVQRLASALDELGIGAEELAPGEFEVGFLIPREAVDNELEQLGEEFEKLDAILVPFMELTGEGRPDLQVRSISSSDFMVFLLAAPGLALTMAKVVESLLASYEKIRGIREKATSLEEDGVPEEITQELRRHANERMSIDIENLTNELVGQAREHLAQEGASV